MASEEGQAGGKRLTAEGGTCDEFGFRIAPEHVDAFKKHCLAQAERRELMRKQWGVLVQEIKDKDAAVDPTTQSRQEQIDAAGERTRTARKLLRGPVVNGISPEYRPFLWPLLCGVEKARSVKGEHVFPSLLQRSEGAERNAELALDLDRTFPGHPLLDRATEGGVEGVAALHRVLNSYALYNPQVGYCQSMNFIVGILLIMEIQEEDAFWIMSHISDSLLPNHFAPPMLGSQVDTKVFKILLRKHLPDLSKHLDDIGLDPGMVCGQWFLCIFCNRMPCATVSHIWDMVFVKGPQAIFQVALAIFKLNQEKLLAQEDLGAAMHIIRDFEAGLFDSDMLLECATLLFAGVGDVNKMRQELLPGVKKEYLDYRRRMDNYKLNENVKKGKELLRGFGGRAWELGNGLLAGAQEVKSKATDAELIKEVQSKVKEAASAQGGWFSGATSLLTSAAAAAAARASQAVPLAGDVPAEAGDTRGGAGAGGGGVTFAGTTFSAFWNSSSGGERMRREGSRDDDDGDGECTPEGAHSAAESTAKRGDFEERGDTAAALALTAAAAAMKNTDEEAAAAAAAAAATAAAAAAKKKEEEEALAKKKEEDDAFARKKAEEEASLKKAKEEEEAVLKKKKGEEEALARKEEEEAFARKKAEEEASLKKAKEEEQEALLKKAKEEEEEALLKKAKKEEEEALLKKAKEEEEEALLKKAKKEEEEALLKKAKEEEEEALLKKTKEEEEAVLKTKKEEEEALARKKEEEEAFARKEEEEEAVVLKQKAEEELARKKAKEEEEALLKKAKEEEEEALLKKAKEEEEEAERKRKQAEEVEALARKEEEEEALLKMAKEEEEAVLKRKQAEEVQKKAEEAAAAAKNMADEQAQDAAPAPAPAAGGDTVGPQEGAAQEGGGKGRGGEGGNMGLDDDLDEFEKMLADLDT